MNYQKGFVTPLIIVIVAILAIGGGLYFYNNQKFVTCWPYCKGMTDQDREAIKQSAIDQGATTTLVGGDRDVHGCIPSAGYSWCEVKNKCLRPWEETCVATSTQTVSTSTCSCSSGYVQEGNVCNPKCYYGTPKCLMPSYICKSNVKSCTPNWSCGWAPCTGGYQGMKAIDSNNCGLPSTGVQIACPALARQCAVTN